MKIALSEHLPILEQLLRKRLRTAPVAGLVQIEKAVPGGEYQLFLTDRSHLPREGSIRAELFLLPGGEALFPGEIQGQLLTGGMNRADPVTFSSIGEDRAMLCLQQEIAFTGTFIGPFEKPVPFDRNYSLYKNLAAGFALALAEIILREE